LVTPCAPCLCVVEPVSQAGMNWNDRRMKLFQFIGVAWFCSFMVVAEVAAASWRGPSHRVSISNEHVLAEFQAGILCTLRNLRTTRSLVDLQPEDLDSHLPIFGLSGIDLDSCEISLESDESEVICRLGASDGTALHLTWTLEPEGDLVLTCSAKSPEPVHVLRLPIFGCNISDYRIVLLSGYGAGWVHQAPWTGSFGDPALEGTGYVHAPVALFEGKITGWFVEGRDANLGPGNLFAQGRDKTADLTMIRGFPVASAEPSLFEIRFRPYLRHWETAVKPYVDWLEHEVGFAPLGEGYHPPWVKDIRVQAYVSVGDFAGLDELAKQLDPTRVFVGRMVGFRNFPMDVKYPNYELTDVAKKWFRYARDLGFHVGAHFNSKGVSREFPDLLEKFRPGLQVITNEFGEVDFDGIPHPKRHVYVSAAYKPWRDYLIEQMREAVDAGVDVIYLDQSMAPGGKFLVDGENGLEGLMNLEKETLEAYPGVAVETEQFNPMCTRYASFALSQMPLGHSLSGYIHHRFLNIVPEGYNSAPDKVDWMTGVMSYGYMIPGARGNPGEDSWTAYAKEFIAYDLVPDPFLVREQCPRYEWHWTHGIMPVFEFTQPRLNYWLFGYRGSNGVTARFTRLGNRQGLVVKEPGKTKRWVGTRMVGVKEWRGPGALENWLLYDGSTLLGLSPTNSYVFNKSIELPHDRFHVTAIPEDYAGYYHDEKRILPQEIGPGHAYYLLYFTGNGEIAMHVPDNYNVCLNDKVLEVDRGNKIAKAQVTSDAQNPGILRVYRRSDEELKGLWADLPWLPPGNRSGRVKEDGNGGFSVNVSGYGILLGKMPGAKSIRIKGAYAMRDSSIGPPGDGVIRINGAELMRLDPGPRPFSKQDFDLDISSYAGTEVMLEFVSDGHHRTANADWFEPRIVVQ